MIGNQKIKEKKEGLQSWSPRTLGRIRLMELPLGLIQWILLNHVINPIISIIVVAVEVYLFETYIVEPHESEESKKEEELYRQLRDTVYDTEDCGVLV